ncbi:MAG: histidine phosphatase family protein [Alphaproteobacteria bacterium]|nr:histidine phosphatase family protein [Alphaproteobacteria bacterium]
MTVFLLLRHGEHGLQHGVLAGRMPGVGLSDRGRAEIEAVAERLAGDAIDALYASPLQRTRESAEIVAARINLPVHYRDDLIELDFGEWTGATFDAIRAHPRWARWNQHRSIATIPGGESMRQVQHRTTEALLALHAEHREGTVLVVSHGDVIRAALVFALGMPLDFYSRIEVSLGSISSIRIDAGGIRVLGVNERPRVRSPEPG